MMSRKHYRQMADIIHNLEVEDMPEAYLNNGRLMKAYMLGTLSARVGSFFLADNPRFDLTRFFKWCDEGSDS